MARSLGAHRDPASPMCRSLGYFGPPARAMTSSRRSPPLPLAGKRDGAPTSPSTLMEDALWSTRATTACGSIARGLRPLTIASCTCTTVRPFARMTPAYGTVISPFVSTNLGRGNEIAGTDPGFGRNEKAARRQLEQRHAHDISDPKANIGRAATIRKDVAYHRGIVREDVFGFRSEPDNRVPQTFRIKLPRPHVRARGPRGWKRGAATGNGCRGNGRHAAEDPHPAQHISRRPP